jgi:hypothetical protein
VVLRGYEPQALEHYAVGEHDVLAGRKMSSKPKQFTTSKVGETRHKPRQFDVY